MKILMIIGALSFGGAERVMANIANYLSNTDEVMICTMFEREIVYHISDKVQIKQGLADKGKTAAIFSIRNIVRKWKPDVALSFLTQINLSTIIALLGTKTPVVVSERNDPHFEPAQMHRKLMRQILYPFATGYVFQTEEARDYFSKRIREKSVVIPNPVFIQNNISPSPIEERKCEFVSVGRLNKQKNFSLLIRSFAPIAQKYPQYSLMIYGEGELRAELTDLIHQEGMENRIRLMGATSCLHETIRDSFAFIMSSDHEGMPNALLEAMSLGLCCISTDCPCGGPREIISSGENGLLVPVNDQKALTDAMERIIKDRTHAMRMMDKARETRVRYDKERIGNKWREYLFEIGNQK